MAASGVEAQEAAELLPVICEPDLYPTNKYQGTEKDIIAASSCGYYDGNLTAREVNRFYDRMADKNDPHPISYGLTGIQYWLRGYPPCRSGSPGRRPLRASGAVCHPQRR